MVATKKNRRGLAGTTAVSKQFKHRNYCRPSCTCQGRGTCTHFAAINLVGPGYRTYFPRAQAIALSLALGFMGVGGTMAATPEPGPVRRNTMNVAVATPTESGVLSCPNSGAGRGVCAAMPDGFGQGASVRKAGGVATFTFLTPCPPDARRNANGGFSVSHVGA